MPSSASSSSVSSASSSSSGMRGSVTMAFRAEGVLESPVWCFASREWDESSSEDGVSRTVYAGTGPNGVVLTSDDFSTWETFMQVDDCHARAVAVWADALFVGTQPKGRIYVHNFASGQEYLFVETEDSAVVAFAEYGGKLYAGTSPAGIVYSFDGIVWKEEYRPYGSGVTTMASYNGLLFVFSKGAEGPVVYNGSSWKVYPDQIDGSAQTAASNRNVVGGIYGSSGMVSIEPAKIASSAVPGTNDSDVQEVRPTSPQFNVMAAVATADRLVFGGMDNGVVLLVTDEKFSKLFDVGVPVTAIAEAGNGALMIASHGTVFLARES